MRCICNIKKSFPKLYKFLYGKSRKNRFIKGIFGFIFGFCFGIFIYLIIIIDLDFPKSIAFLFGLVISLLFGMGAGLSTQLRCIIFLTLPSFGGRAGRGVIKTLVLAYIISGPIENLSNNGKEVIRVFACTTSLTFNLTKTRYALMFKPFSDALLTMKADANEVKDTLRSIRDVSSPVIGEVEDESEMKKMKEQNDYLDESLGDTLRSDEVDAKYKTVGEQSEAKRFENQYLKKIEMRCESQFTKASKNCRQMFVKAYDTCYETVSWIAAWILCWPMKLDFICNIAQALGGSSRCDPSKEIDPGFGEGYAYLKQSRDVFSKRFQNVKMQIKLDKYKDLIDFRDGRETAKAIWHTVKKKKRILDEFLTILKRILVFVFLRVFINAQKYHDRYLREIEFDNIYITPYFRRIDARRKTKGDHYLLPLKKIETKKLIDPCSLKPLKKENEKVIKQTIHLLMEMITATTFILLDRLFYEALDLVRRHAKINYIQTGKHDMKLEIKGTGLIANLLRSVVRGFNIKKRIHIERNNEKCLPKPTQLSNYYLYKIYSTYFVIWLLMLIQMYTQRLQRIICALFYPKREKKRILYLYNETLKRRIGFFRFMRKKIKKLIKENRLKQNFNICKILRIRYPKLCGCLRIFSVARRKCMVCEEREALKSKYIQCQNPNCYFIYCPDCWQDLGQTCFACNAYDDDTTSGLDDSSNDELR